MSRWKAFLIHLSISAAVVGSIGALVVWLWYPPALLRMAEMLRLMTIIAVVDIVIGPLVTLIIYRHGKPGLRFDLTVIAVLQFSLLAYGLHTLAGNRPVFLVAVKDRIELVTALDIADEDLAEATGEFATRSWTGARLVGAKLPTDPKALSELHFEALAGRDVHVRPSFYVDYADTGAELRQNAKPVADLVARMTRLERARIESVADGNALTDLHYVPLTNSRKNVALALLLPDPSTPFIPVDIDPWEVASRAPNAEPLP